METRIRTNTATEATEAHRTLVAERWRRDGKSSMISEICGRSMKSETARKEPDSQEEGWVQRSSHDGVETILFSHEPAGPGANEAASELGSRKVEDDFSRIFLDARGLRCGIPAVAASKEASRPL